jgi:hypothetical protein
MWIAKVALHRPYTFIAPAFFSSKPLEVDGMRRSCQSFNQ